MNFLDLLKIEFMKVRRSKIVPLIFIAPLLVVISGVASLSKRNMGGILGARRVGGQWYNFIKKKQPPEPAS